MTGDSNNDARSAERALALSYAPSGARAALAALLALDDRLGAIARATREPVAGQLRLGWWREALAALDTAPPPAEPVLRALAAEALSLGVTGRSLAVVAEGWERLLAEPADLAGFAAERGGGLFAAMAQALGAADRRAIAAGEGWALADLALRSADPTRAVLARREAAARWPAGLFGRWPRALRSLGALALLARADLANVAPGSPRRVGRLAWHRLTGR